MTEQPRKDLQCPLCKNTEFKKEEGRIQGMWGMSNHKVDIFVCIQCSYVMLFSQGRSYWNVD